MTDTVDDIVISINASLIILSMWLLRVWDRIRDCTMRDSGHQDINPPSFVEGLFFEQ